MGLFLFWVWRVQDHGIPNVHTDTPYIGRVCSAELHLSHG